MGTGKAAEGHGIEPLAWKAGVADAIQTVDARAIEGHGQQARQAQARDGAIGAPHAAEEAAVGAGGANLAVLDAAGQPRHNRFKPLDQAVGIGLFFGGVVGGVQPSPGLHGGGGEAVHDVAALRSQGGIEQGRDRHKNHPLFVFHGPPVFEQQVVAVGARPNQLSFDAQMQREEGGRGLVAPAPGAFGLGGMAGFHQRLGPAGAWALLASEGVPAGGIGNHPPGVDLLAVGQLYAYRFAALKQHLGDPGLVANGAAMAL